MSWPPRLLLALLLCAVMAESSAQAPAASLKAAYVLNFTKFTHWPEESTHLRLCLVGHSEVASVLERAADRRIAGRRLEIRRLRMPTGVMACHLIYFSELDLVRARRMLAALMAHPVLTVSDIEGFSARGGMIELLLVDRRLRFNIDLEAAQQAGLRLDPQLLALAHQVFRSSLAHR